MYVPVVLIPSLTLKSLREIKIIYIEWMWMLLWPRFTSIESVFDDCIVTLMETQVSIGLDLFMCMNRGIDKEIHLISQGGAWCVWMRECWGGRGYNRALVRGWGRQEFSWVGTWDKATSNCLVSFLLAFSVFSLIWTEGFLRFPEYCKTKVIQFFLFPPIIT